jgi:hypothetical protein
MYGNDNQAADLRTEFERRLVSSSFPGNSIGLSMKSVKMLGMFFVHFSKPLDISGVRFHITDHDQ